MNIPSFSSPTDEAHAVHISSRHADLLILLLLHLHVSIVLLVRVPPNTTAAATTGAGIPLTLGRTSAGHSLFFFFTREI